MDSNCFWSTPRRQNPSPFHVHTNDGNVSSQTPGLIRTTASVDSVQTRSPYNVSPANTKNPETRIGGGRPCLAGTQTAYHQANQHTTVTELPNISTFGDLTHDSSGFASLLVDQKRAQHQKLRCLRHVLCMPNHRLPKSAVFHTELREMTNPPLVGMGTATQELLTRLLANQFPELVFSASSLPAELKQERPNWSTESNSSLSRPTLPANRSPRPSASVEPQTELTSLRGSGQTTPMQVSLDEAVRGPGYQPPGVGTSVDGCVGQTQDILLERNDRPNRVDSSVTTCYPPTASTPPRNNADLHSTRPVNHSGTGTTNPVAMLAGLLGTSADQLLGLLNNQLRQCIGNDTGCAPALSALLAGLQETAMTNRCRQLRERTSSVNQLNLSSYNENGIVPNLTQQAMASTSNLNEEIARLAEPYKRFLCSLESDIERAANVYRTSASTLAQRREAAYHWSGKLPVRVCRSMAFSRKVFLGGVPWDSTSEDLIMAFSRFGNVTVSWPQQDATQFSAIRSRNPSPKGYCYLIFDHESSVTDLIDACVRDPTRGGDYYTISSSRFRSKDVQVIPWAISDSQYTKSGPYRPDTKRTVFIGALHGMITAEALVTIMNDLFGNVIFAALDTDKYKYPIGSGRVAFSSYKSYLKAVTANFVDIRTSKFIKTIQIDPYLEDSLCNSCQNSPGIYFCRDFECFRYFCPACWQLWHNSTGSLFAHKPLRRTFKPIPERQLPSLIKH
ncbi:hypothetical protein T265_06314 [Opisthorchis viverrini]|uniref:RRM domain-containing protein n=1 Tax=Opisthorchis viverrini TaxID=6198 RepID=A0A074ZGQ3_OPIVI|nr:hypothetical protein T265_06314 [Opisthorchis viverrini]KER26461.1 hypothetical protein T265_06314 [Opisthorchis viverrini]